MNPPLLLVWGKSLVLVACLCWFQPVQSAVIYSSRAAMDLTMQTTRSYTIPTAFQAEEQISFYLESLFQPSDGSSNDPEEDNSNTNINDNNDFTVLSIDVQVKNQGTVTADRTVLQTVVQMIYLSHEPQLVAQLLVDRIVVADMAETLQMNQLSIAYEDLLPNLELQYVPDEDDGRPKADKGLIAVTVFMAAALLMVASAVLYITGGWAAFQQCCVNCLFEEVEEEDDYAVAKKSTFQVQSFDEGDSEPAHDGRDIEVTSQAASDITDATNLRTVPDGMLGAMAHPNPAAGLGIKTPNRSDTSGYDSELNMTPLSDATAGNGKQHPLGITSMRKLPLMDHTDDENDHGGDDDIEGGLAHLILKRRFREGKPAP